MDDVPGMWYNTLQYAFKALLFREAEKWQIKQHQKKTSLQEKL